MIIFRTVRYKNFLSTGNYYTEVRLDKSKSTLIVGANGAGKTTLLEAIIYALFGRPHRDVKKGQLINSVNQKGMVVEIEFTIGKKEYKVIRGLKPAIFEIYCDGTMIDQHADVREYQEHLEQKILKLNYKSFTQIAVIGSASFVPFMQLKEAHRREVVEDVLDIQIFSTMFTLLKDRVSKNRQELSEIDHQINLTEQEIELHSKHMDQMQQNNDDLIKKREGIIASNLSEVDETAQEIDKLQDEVAELQKTAKAAEKREEKIDQFFEVQGDLRTRVSRLNQEIRFFTTNTSCPTCKQEIDEDFKHSCVNDKQEKVSKIQEALDQLEFQINRENGLLEQQLAIVEKISPLQQEITSLMNHSQGLQRHNRLLQQEIGELREHKAVVENREEMSSLLSRQTGQLASKEDMLKSKAVHDAASILLKDGGIKTKIIKQYIPVINKLINKYLAAMDFFVSFELDENFVETIKSRHRDDFTYAAFSEGEKMRIDLAILFAWRAVAKLRNSTATNLLFMDETFDSSLDGAGVEEFLKILDQLHEDTNTFIISHKGDALYDKFHSLIRFEKVKGFSRIARPT